MIIFYFKEAIKSISRAKLSFAFSLFSVVISLLLVALLIISKKTSYALEIKLKQQFIIQAFVEENVKDIEIKQIEKEIEKLPGVSKLKLISKEEAVEIFKKETGEDFISLLEYNPLPASFQIEFDKSLQNKNEINQLIEKIKVIKGIESVSFQFSLFEKIMNFLQRINCYLVIISIVIAFVSIYLVYSTLRLIIELNKYEVETMKLVGASLATIKIPIILNGMIIAVVGSIITSVILYLSFYYIKNLTGILPIMIDMQLIVIIISAGLVISLFSGILATKRVTLKL